MKITKTIVVIALGVTVCFAAYGKTKKKSDFVRTFDAPVGQVYLTAVQVAAANWHLQYSDKDAHALSFSTGRNMRVWEGFDMSVVCLDAGEGRTTVTLHPQKRGEQRQLFAWKEGNRISRTFLDKLGDALKADTGPMEQTSTASQSSPEQPEANHGMVNVSSDPSGADITVDGSFVGNAPATLDLKAGVHSISLQRTGYQTWTRQIKVLAGESVKLSTTLTKEP